MKISEKKLNLLFFVVKNKSRKENDKNQRKIFYIFLQKRNK